MAVVDKFLEQTLTILCIKNCSPPSTPPPTPPPPHPTPPPPHPSHTPPIHPKLNPPYVHCTTCMLPVVGECTYMIEIMSDFFQCI